MRYFDYFRFLFYCCTPKSAQSNQWRKQLYALISWMRSASFHPPVIGAGEDKMGTEKSIANLSQELQACQKNRKYKRGLVWSANIWKSFDSKNRGYLKGYTIWDLWLRSWPRNSTLLVNKVRGKAEDFMSIMYCSKAIICLKTQPQRLLTVDYSVDEWLTVSPTLHCISIVNVEGNHAVWKSVHYWCIMYS